jgi:hypothetical protein
MSGKSNIADYVEGSPIRELFAETALSLYTHFMLSNPDAVRQGMQKSGIDAEKWIQAAKDYEALRAAPRN